MKGQKVNDHSVLFDEQGQRLFANFAGKLFERDKMLIVWFHFFLDLDLHPIFETLCVDFGTRTFACTWLEQEVCSVFFVSSAKFAWVFFHFVIFGEILRRLVLTGLFLSFRNDIFEVFVEECSSDKEFNFAKLYRLSSFYFKAKLLIFCRSIIPEWVILLLRIDTLSVFIIKESSFFFRSSFA